MARVAVLGTGIMGAPIARHLCDASNEVVVWNRTRAKAEAVRAAVADSPVAAVEGVDAVVTMLADGPAIEEILISSGALAAMLEGAAWVQMSTIAVADTDRFAEAAAVRGIAFVDAPVLGSRSHAEEGQLTILASGPDEELERVEALLAPVTRTFHWLGPAGTGTRIKLVVNGWILSGVEGLAEAIALAERLGLDARRFLRVIEGSPLDWGYAQIKGALMLARDFPAAFPLKLARKDLGLVVDAAGTLELPVLRATLAQYERALQLGAGDEDTSAVIRALEL